VVSVSKVIHTDNQLKASARICPFTREVAVSRLRERLTFTVPEPIAAIAPSLQRRSVFRYAMRA
jgi:hypothetical protein